MSKPVIFATRDDFPEAGFQLLKHDFEIMCWSGPGVLTKEKLIENVKGKYAILCLPGNTIDKEVIDEADELKVVSTCSVGYDHIDVGELKSKGIRIGFTPGVLSESVAEFTIALLLAASRRILESHHAILTGQWTPETWAPMWMCGHGLDRSIVGILGYGRIGHTIAKKLKAFNIADLYYYSRREVPEAQELGGIMKDIDEIMQCCDFIIVSFSLNSETKGIVNKKRINLMKPNAVIVNTGRGDQEALTDALRTNRIFGAGLDVFESEPLTTDNPMVKLCNAVTTPHIASATEKCRIEMSEMAAKNILAVYHDEKMPAEL